MFIDLFETRFTVMLLSFLLLDKLFCSNACWCLEVIKDYWAHMSGQKKRVLVRRNGPNVLKCFVTKSSWPFRWSMPLVQRGLSPFGPIVLSQHRWNNRSLAIWTNSVESTSLAQLGDPLKTKKDPLTCWTLAGIYLFPSLIFIKSKIMTIGYGFKWCMLWCYDCLLYTSPSPRD